MRFKKFFVIVCLITVTNYSCRQNVGKNISQGEIHYRIEYSGNSGTLLKELKPKNLIVSFKDNKILFDISAPIGDASISNLSNPKIEAYEMYVNMLGYKYSYKCQPDEVPPGFSSMDGMEIKKTSKTTVICGFNCKNAIVTFASDRSKVYNIWYTNEIKVKNPNYISPFKEIDGILMSFFYFLGKTELHFEAENVYKRDIPDNVFERKEKYKPVTKANMEDLILKMVNL